MYLNAHLCSPIIKTQRWKDSYIICLKSIDDSIYKKAYTFIGIYNALWCHMNYFCLNLSQHENIQKTLKPFIFYKTYCFFFIWSTLKYSNVFKIFSITLIKHKRTIYKTTTENFVLHRFTNNLWYLGLHKVIPLYIYIYFTHILFFQMQDVFWTKLYSFQWKMCMCILCEICLSRF